MVLIGPPGANGTAGVRVDLTHVTQFEAKQKTHAIRVNRLDGVNMAAELPAGWEGSFELERGSPAADDFVASLSRRGLRRAGCWVGRSTSIFRKWMEA